MLEELVDNSRTDKNIVHSYLPLYQKLLESKKETAKNVLEIGIHKGGSIKLWSDFFTHATIYGIDVAPLDKYVNDLKDRNVILYTSTNAYQPKVANFFLQKGTRFDFLLDDGPHTLESMKWFIRLYTPLLTDDGILIIEDIQLLDWVEILTKVVPDHLKRFIKTYDLRSIKHKYDDIVFTINKSLV